MKLFTRVAVLTAVAALVVPAAFAQAPKSKTPVAAPKAIHKTVTKKAAPKAKKPVVKKPAVKKPVVKKPAVKKP
jgi:hypothetical protein